jgi:hypothetical protein
LNNRGDIPRVVSEAKADRIVRLRKVIGQRLQWERQPGRRMQFRLQAAVFGEGIDDALELRGNFLERSWSFVLLYKGIRIRCLDVAGTGHRNPDRSYIPGGVPHKHRWTDAHEDQEAFIPNDIDDTDINTALLTFLQEVNIDLIGDYQPLMRGDGL